MLTLKKIIGLKNIFFLFVFTIAFKAGQGQSLLLKKTQQEYSAHQDFVFNLSNKSDTAFHYLVSLEILQEDGRWQEVKNDVFTSRITKSAKLSQVAGKATKKNVFYPSKLMPLSYEYYYRLKIPYGKDYRVNQGIIYSDKFKFIK
jgi:hypothetical protein